MPSLGFFYKAQDTYNEMMARINLRRLRYLKVLDFEIMKILVDNNLHPADAKDRLVLQVYRHHDLRETTKILLDEIPVTVVSEGGDSCEPKVIRNYST